MRQDTGGSMVIRVHARPGAARSRVEGVDPWRGALAVRVRAQAKEGEANEEVCALLARALGVPRAAVEVVRGLRSREKLVRVAGASEAQVRQALEGQG